MYKRSKKDDYRKRIEEMIGGSQKRSRESFASSSSSNNIDTDFSNDTTSIIINDSNDDAVNITSNDINDNSSSINDNADKIHIQRWKPINTRIEEQLTNLGKKIDHLEDVIGEMREELRELKKLKELQQPDQSFLMEAIKDIAKLIMKVSIYPSKEELRGATEAYLKENHIEFFNSFTETRWTSYYNDNIHKSLLKQVRSLRGSLATKIRDAIFATYGEVNLPLMKSNAGPSEIAKWKKTPEVSKCYENLFKKMDKKKDSPSVITHIIEKAFMGKEYSNPEFAYAIAICKTMLNPKHDAIQMKESIIKNKMKHYLDRINKKLTLTDDDDDDDDDGSNSVEDEIIED